MANEIVIKEYTDKVARIDDIFQSFVPVLGKQARGFAEAIHRAKAIAELRQIMDEKFMAELMTLQGTAVGFKTDRDDKGGYSWQIVRDCVIEAGMKGLQPYGNEFNIIGGRAYIPKEGITALIKLLNIPCAITPDIPKMTAQGAEVPVDIEWSIGGEKHTKRLVFPVRVNSGMGVAAVQGKGAVRGKKWLWEYITGMELNDGDVESAKQPIDVTPKESRFDIKAEVVEDAPANNAEDELAVKLTRDGISIDTIRKWHEMNGWPFDAGTCLAQYAQLVEAYNGLDVAVKEALNG